MVSNRVSTRCWGIITHIFYLTSHSRGFVTDRSNVVSDAFWELAFLLADIFILSITSLLLFHQRSYVQLLYWHHLRKTYDQTHADKRTTGINLELNSGYQCNALTSVKDVWKLCVMPLRTRTPPSPKRYYSQRWRVNANFPVIFHMYTKIASYPKWNLMRE